MRIYKLILVSVFALLIITGCGTKRQSFEPELLAGEVDYDGSLPAKIIDVTKEGATLENGQVITKEGLQNIRLPQGYRFIFKDQERFVAVSNCGKLIITDKNGKELYSKTFDTVVASASLKDNFLAIVLANNKIELHDIKSKNVVYSKQGDKVYAHDSRIAAPYFFDTITVFPTLDGKLVIVDMKEMKVLREVIVKSEKFFTNIIYMDVLGDRLVAATKKRVVSINPQSMSFLDEEVKDVIILENRVLVFTKDGRIVLTDADLKVLKERKFTFASFSGTIHGEFVYVVEGGGYLIATDLDLMSSNVYELPDDIDTYLFTTKDTLYFGDNYFKLAKTR